MFEAIFDQYPVPCAILAHGHYLSHCNDAFAHLLGYRRDELRDCSRLFVMEDAAEPVAIHDRHDREVAGRRFRFRHKDGRTVELSCVTAPLGDGAEPTGAILQVTGFPEREAALDPPASRSSPAFASLAIDHIQEAAYLIDADGRILGANRVACDTLGYGWEELLKLSVTDIDPNFDSGACDLGAAGTTHRSAPVLDTYHLRRNGERFPVHIRLVPVQHEGANCMMALVLDVSKKQQLEALRYGILEGLARGAPPTESLQLIVNCVEEICPETVASIMLVNDAGTHLEPGPSNRLPSRYLDAIRAVPIGEGQGACGTAAALKRAIQVEDTASHPYFHACRSVILDAGLLSCWSTPILSGVGEVLGTFCIYLKTTGQPSETGVKQIARRASHFAAIALERHRAERQVRESQQRYRDIFDNALDAMALLELAGDQRLLFLEANPVMERTVGIPREQMVGKTTEEITSLTPELAANINAHYHQCLTRGEVVEGEARFDLPIGKRILHSTMIPVRCPNGSYHRIVLIARDITERWQAEKLLHTREQEFRALVEHSPDGVIRYDSSGNAFYINPVLRELIGGGDEATSSVLEQRIVPTDRSAYREARRTVRNSGIEAHLVIRLEVSGKRHVQYHDVRLVPEFTTEGNVKSVLAVMRDITPLKETEFQLRSLVENSPNYIWRVDASGRL
ncbi:PAS domain S-box protein [Marinobacter halodurans]|uniref:PAS domain S-box protein n=1 Tax=Marinobacter halodurans TaxID=2528979 RepID=A0ABY1ZNZ4_9GAMM|nr:PAS domain S-box protein [Marinobacter halodurans]TBW58455.1 PAS domain S-box protein [Marinobacter halodurans]